MAADCGAKFLTVEFFPDCGRLKRDLHDSCMLEVTGVETAGDYKTLITAGAERIGTSHAEEIYAELMKEAENLSFAVNFAEPLTVASPFPRPRRRRRNNGGFDADNFRKVRGQSLRRDAL